MRILIVGLILTNALWFTMYSRQTRVVVAMTQRAEALYAENYANDHAAAECAERTGYRYNCADGSQRVSCEEGQ